MRVGVGSGNPVKRRAVERALEADGDVEHGTVGSVESVRVDSGVSEQPTGHAETVAGAENRAAAVLESGEYDLGVGLEGGVARFEGVDGLFLVMWASVDDGDRVGRGSGPSLRLPDDVADRVESGAELGPVMDDVLDTTGVARRGGAAGVLTNGGVDRAGALSAAVSGALGPFVSDLY
ncbi:MULTISPECIES: DUF84 family protein [Haloferacaceae]|uniref:Probable inosine/xanthosine triphosphatase n=1 Tax=Halorubrum glutamatedens TaxID=2707018 RepID=A0ABD5QV04_9EURY|nr:inosine/xanthosine triphosphatase [Halobellus captivus]